MTLARKTLALLHPLFHLALSTFALAEGHPHLGTIQVRRTDQRHGHGIALRSEGGLELAPAFKALATTPSTYIWSIASDSAGNIYAAAGSPARVYRITPDGQITTIFEPQELQVQALVVVRERQKNGKSDKRTVVYAATAPDGKVYRLESRGISEDAKARCEALGIRHLLRSLAPSTSGTSRSTMPARCMSPPAITAKSTRSAPTDSTRSFSRAMKCTFAFWRSIPKGNLIAGSDGSGLVYRIAPNGEAFVLYSAPKKEITALAIDSAGNIYAAAAGEKRPEAPRRQ
jgi:hypothetical protein